MRWFWVLPLCGLALGCEFSGGSEKNGPVEKITCDGMADPLQTGGLEDKFDCMILASVREHMHPDPMLIKAQVAQESAFDNFAVSPDAPCGIEVGWTDLESRSFGLTQVTPACNEASLFIMADGHPNLTRDMQSDLWATSAFNPKANIDEGVRTCMGFLDNVRTAHPGCTETQYALMSAGAFNSGPRSVTGCNTYNLRAQTYVTAVLAHYAGFAERAGWTNPY
jgi:hypothetical protein